MNLWKLSHLLLCHRNIIRLFMYQNLRIFHFRSINTIFLINQLYLRSMFLVWNFKDRFGVQVIESSIIWCNVKGVFITTDWQYFYIFISKQNIFMAFLLDHQPKRSWQHIFKDTDNYDNKIRLLTINWNCSDKQRKKQ